MDKESLGVVKGSACAVGVDCRSQNKNNKRKISEYAYTRIHTHGTRCRDGSFSMTPHPLSSHILSRENTDVISLVLL